jgi:chromosome segregation ATPase
MEELEQLRGRYRKTADELRDAQRDIGEAEQTQGQIRERLDELGFSPDKDLDEQLAEKRGKLTGVIDEVEGILADAETVSSEEAAS